MIKLYRININNWDDPLENKELLNQIDEIRRKKIMRYHMPDDRKRSLAAGIIIKHILNENGLSENSLSCSENGKPLADGLFFNVSHSGNYVVGVVSDCEVGCDIEKVSSAPMKVAQHYFSPAESEYMNSEPDKDRAFFTIWTLKESYMKMTGQGLSLALDSFEILKTVNGFSLGKTTERQCFFKTLEFDGYIFSVSNETDFVIKQTDFYDIL